MRRSHLAAMMADLRLTVREGAVVNGYVRELEGLLGSEREERMNRILRLLNNGPDARLGGIILALDVAATDPEFEGAEFVPAVRHRADGLDVVELSEEAMRRQAETDPAYKATEKWLQDQELQRAARIAELEAAASSHTEEGRAALIALHAAKDLSKPSDRVPAYDRASWERTLHEVAKPRADD